MGDSVSQTSSSIRKTDVILFTAQIFLITMVTIVSLVNLTFGYGNQNLWTVLLTSCMGIVMPNPKIKVRQEDNKSMFGSIRKTTKKNGPGVLHDSVL